MWNCIKKEKILKVSHLNKSDYSLVSSSDICPDAVQLWLGLPDEIKKDPAWAPFKNYYDKQNGKSATTDNTEQNKKSNGRARLPMVKSSPAINNNLIVQPTHVDKEKKNIGQTFHGTGTQDSNTSDVETKQTFLKDLPASLKKLKTGHVIKITSLLAVWIFFTIIFLSFNEKKCIRRQSSIAPSEQKSYYIDTLNVLKSLSISITGPFMEERTEQQLSEITKYNMTKLNIWYELRSNNSADITVAKSVSNVWELCLSSNDPDFSIGEKRTRILKLVSNMTILNSNSYYALKLNTTGSRTIPFSFSYQENPQDLNIKVIYAFILLVGLYILIIFEIINRTMAAIILSLCSLAVLALIGERPSLVEIISWLDVETLLLLFGMMLLVALIAETGIFDYLAVFAFEKTNGKIWPLLNLLCIITAILSTFLDNVTTVLLITPITIRLCEVMQLDPVPILMSMVIFSNIGGTATPVGDPPNVIIATNKDIIDAGLNFADFTLHMSVGIIFVCIQSFLQLRYVHYRNTNKLKLSVSSDIQELKQQIAIWKRAADSLKHLSKEGCVVKERLEKKVRKLTEQLNNKMKENSKKACTDNTFNTVLNEMKEKYKIKDKVLLIKASIATSFVIIFYFLHAIPEFNRISLGWTALLGAVLLLILADREDLEPILHRVEWSTLLFFAALFVFMEALTKLGLIDYIGSKTEYIILSVDEKSRLSVAMVLILWVSGITSAFVDNIPLTTMMVRIVSSLGSNPQLGLPLAPLVFALSFGVCLGGNGTLIGASANVITAGVAEQHGYKITFKHFFLLGFPLMIGHLIVATVYLLVCHSLFTWH